MAGPATLTIDILADASKAQRELQSIDQKLGQVGRGAKAAVGLAAGAVAATGIVQLGTAAVKAAEDSQRVARTTEQIIKATGGAAKVSAADVGRLSTQISRAAGVDDELVQAGANLLLTFKNVKNEGAGVDAVFNRANVAAADLAAAGFGSIEGNAKQLGKALNDPIKGISALAKAGVTFTDQQKEQIKVLTESGDLLGAQKIILSEVEAQVGGTAEAAATGMGKFQQVMDEALEQVGGAILPLITELLPRIAPILSDLVTQLIPVVEPLLGLLADLAGTILEALQPVLPPLVAVLKKVVAALGEGLMQVLEALAPALPPLAEALVAILEALLPLLPVIAQLLVLLAPVIVIVAKLIAVVAQLVAWLVEHLIGALLALDGPAKAVARWFQNVWEKLEPVRDVIARIVGAVGDLVGWLLDHLGPALDAMTAPLEAVVGFFQDLWDVGQDVIGFLRDAVEWLGKVADKLNPLKAAGGLIADIGGAIGSLNPFAVGGGTITLTDELTRALAGERQDPRATQQPAPVTINVAVADRTTGYELGQAVVGAIATYEQNNGRSWRTPTPTGG